ncbi:helix-turn-helix domain-containing protein [Martelella lutilitoris]|nr:helix-turn-helix transcriptional regulator [Martelella lutilitoris]
MDSKIRQIVQNNIRYICSRFSSITEAADMIGINRQQLNKYLSGSGFPSLSTLSNIARKNGLTVDDLMLEHDAFVDRIDSRGRSSDPLPAVFNQTISDVIAYGKAKNASLNWLTGSYIFCLRSLADPAKITVSYGRIFQSDGLTFQKTFSPLPDALSRRGSLRVLKHEACVIEVGGLLHFYRVTNLDRTTADIGLKIMIPSFSGGGDYMSGYVLATERARKSDPRLLEVMMKRLPASSALSAVRRHCGVFDMDDPDLDPVITDFFRSKSPQTALDHDQATASPQHSIAPLRQTSAHNGR